MVSTVGVGSVTVGVGSVTVGVGLDFSVGSSDILELDELLDELSLVPPLRTRGLFDFGFLGLDERNLFNTVLFKATC